MRITNTIKAEGRQSVSNQTNRVPPEKSVDDYLKQLQKEHPNLVIRVGTVSGKDQIKELAAKQKSPNQITIDPEIIKKMATDEGAKLKYEHIIKQLQEKHKNLRQQAQMSGKNILATGSIIDKDGNIKSYTVSETIKKEPPMLVTQRTEPNETLERFQNSSKKKQSVISYKFNYGSHMAKLSQAKSVQNVRGVIQAQYREISKAKQQIENKSDSAVAVRRIRNVIHKAGIKISRLRKEEQLQLRQQVAEKKQKAELQRALAEELKEKKRARKGQESCDTVDSYSAMQNTHRAHGRYEQVLREYQAIVTDMGGGNVSVDVGSTTGGEAGGAIEISIEVSV